MLVGHSAKRAHEWRQLYESSARALTFGSSQGNPGPSTRTSQWPLTPPSADSSAAAGLSG